MRIKKNIVNKLKLAEKAIVYTQLTGIKVARFADSEVALSKLCSALKTANPAVIEKKVEAKYQDILGIQNMPTDKGKVVLEILSFFKDGATEEQIVKKLKETFSVAEVTQFAILSTLRNLYEPYFVKTLAGKSSVYQITEKGQRYLDSDERTEFMELYEAKPEIANFKQIDWYAPGPESGFAGKRLYRATEDGENPRREGSHGYHSFERIIDGISYEEYKISGGRTNDLMWDYKEGNVEITKEIRIEE